MSSNFSFSVLDSVENSEILHGNQPLGSEIPVGSKCFGDRNSNRDIYLRNLLLWDNGFTM